MKKFRLIFLFVICTINVCAQTVDNDSIFKMFLKLREQETNTLLNYRYTETDILGYDNYGLCTAYYKLPFGNSNYYKGIDISYHGIYADTIIHNRIIQLLKGNYFIGEIDTARKEIEKPITYRKYRELLHACRYVDNFEIKNLLIQMYHDEKYSDYKEDIYEYLLYKHIEPYTSECLKKYRYKKEQSYEEQVLACNYLWLIQTQQSFRYLSEYLFSDKYYTNIICEDNTYECESLDDIIVEIDCESGVADTIIKCENNTNKGDTLKYDIDVDYIDLEDEDTNPIIAEWEYKTYLYWGVFSIIQKSILNLDLYDMLGITNDRFVSQEFLTEDTRKKIYNWMQKNYGKYVFKNRW